MKIYLGIKGECADTHMYTLTHLADTCKGGVYIFRQNMVSVSAS